MLLGYAVRTWGPGWRFRDGDAAAYDRREFRSARSAWRRFTAGLGAVIATIGAALVLLTFILMLVNPGDGIGSAVALSVTGLMLVGVAVWAWLFFSRFGGWGITATPDPLTSYAPAHYDSRDAMTSPMTARSQARVTDEPEEPEYDEDELLDEEIDEDDEAELAARSSKFELHHPEGEDAAEPDEAPSTVEDEERFEADYSKYETHHPERETSPTQDGEEEMEPIGEYVDALTPEEVSEDIVDAADEEPMDGNGSEAPIETYEDLVGRAAADGMSGDVAEDDPLEVIPDAHDAGGSLMVDQTEIYEETREDASGREDALRRLRERRAQRARQQRTDDDA